MTGVIQHVFLFLPKSQSIVDDGVTLSTKYIEWNDFFFHIVRSHVHTIIERECHIHQSMLQSFLCVC